MIAKGENFFDGRNGGVVCAKCQEYMCSACDTIIKGNFVTFAGKKVHSNCFKCAKCREVLDVKDFYEKNSKPYCKKDFQLLA